MIKHIDEYRPHGKTPGNYGPAVTLAQPPAGPVYGQGQTAANYNYNRAMADFRGNPRSASKQHQRAGISSSAGTDYLGATQAAGEYANALAGAEQSQMADAYANANYQLDDTIQRNQYGTALAGMMEQANQANWMNNMQTAQNATGFMGDMFGNMTSAFGGGGKSLLSGLL